MNIALINPPFSQYGGLKGHGGTMMPLNLCYLAAYVRDKFKNTNVTVIDAEINGLSHEKIASIIKEIKPELIGITANTCSFDSVVSLTIILKLTLPGVPIAIGGPHPSALPELSLIESKSDFAVIGEGELTFGDLVEHLTGGSGDFSKIAGLCFIDKDGNVHTNEKRELLKDLDMLPFPARDLIDSHLYSPPPTKKVSLGANTLIAGGRGCPFGCGFCGAQSVWSRKTRFRTAENIVSEMKECTEKYHIKSFNFTDELFTVDRERTLELCQEILENDLKISWVCSARAQGLDKDVLQAMKDAGCREISFGIESGNREILRKMSKSLDLDEAQEVISLTKKMGITTHASYMFGYIGETEQTMQETIRFAEILNTDVAVFFIASPLPGTPFYGEAKRNKYIREDATWIDYSPLSNSRSVLSMPDLKEETIRKYQRKAIRNYYFRISYIVPRMLRIRHIYEISNLFGGLKLFFRLMDSRR